MEDVIMVVGPSKKITVTDYLTDAEIIFGQKDRLTSMLAEINERVPMLPLVIPIVAMDLNRVPRPLLVDSVGRIAEASAANILIQTTNIGTNSAFIYRSIWQASNPMFGAPTVASDVAAGYQSRKLSITQFALAGGVKANQDLTGMVAIAGYKLCVKILGIISDSNIAAAIITFHDNAPAALPGLITGAAALALVAYTNNTQIRDCILGPGTANKKGQVDVAGGAGVEVITVMAEYWYES